MRLLLLPFAFLYQTISWIRNFLYDNGIFKSTGFGISVISIGNLTVGGTGKTPHTEFLLKNLHKDFNIAMLSRGYKRKSKGFLLADENSSFADIGDEPKQIKMKCPKIKVAVCKSRVEGVKKLLNHDQNIDIIILDDAHQHRKIKAGINILLTDYNNLFIHDSFLPYGRLRDNKSQYERANIIIITKCSTDLKPIDRRIISTDINLLPYQKIFFSYIKYGEITPVFKFKKNKINKETQILLITGIANSKPLIEYLEKNISKNITHFDFPDHFSFDKKSIQKINNGFMQIKSDNKIIITTEKDAVRFRENLLLNDNIKKFFNYIPIEIDFLFETKEGFNNQIINYVRKNKANQRLHSKTNKF